MVKTLLTISIALVLSLESFGQDTAAFDWLTYTACTGDSTYFNGSYTTVSGNPDSLRWNFDDTATGSLNTSNIDSTFHLFSGAGTYNVQLIVFWATFSDTIVQAITIKTQTPPTAAYMIPPPDSSCAGVIMVPIAVGVGGGSTYSFIWGDGSPNQTSNFKFGAQTYSTPGDFTLTLAVENSCGRDTLDSVITIIAPTSDFSNNPNSYCIGQAINFTDLSSPGPKGPIASWDWNFGDGYTDTLQNTSHVYDIPGTYTVNLVTKDQMNCQAGISKTITLIPDTTIANISWSVGCPCNEISFAGNGNAANWRWDFGDGDTSILKNPGIHTYALPGRYTVRLDGKSSLGCSIYQYTNIEVCPNDELWKSKSNNNWLFYNNAGLTFSAGTPTSILGGQLSSPPAIAPEGCATISDPLTGALLFYTNGDNVWDASHSIMLNGSGLLGNASSSQSAAILPFPGNKNKYYIFTNSGSTGGAPQLSAYYSVVDMTLNGGLGGVEAASKNTFLTNTQGSEAVSVTAKQKETCQADGEYWVIYATDHIEYKIYAINSSGVALKSTQTFTPPPTSTAGEFNRWGNSAFSNNGTKYVQSAAQNGFFLYDFDINTGTLKNQLFIPRQVLPSGSQASAFFCFSPNDRYLYVVNSFIGFGRVLQIDLLSNDILASITMLYSSNIKAGDAWLGDDDKIYIGFENKDSLAVINNPNLPGTSCGFQRNGVYLGGNIGKASGLQNIYRLYTVEDSIKSSFITNNSNCSSTISVTNESDSFDYTDPCSFLYSRDTVVYYWDFGDSTNSRSQNPITHNYTSPGTYNLQLIVGKPYRCIYDTFIQSITIDTLPILSFISDSACFGDTTHFTSSVSQVVNPPISYNWTSPVNDTLANPAVIMPITGNTSIIMTITDSTGCSYSDTNSVIVHDIPLAVDSNYTICFGGSFIMRGGLGTEYAWSPKLFLNDSTLNTPTANPDSSGSYQVIVNSLFCGTDTGLHNFVVNPLPIIQTINDTTIDLGDNITLNTIGANSYIWSPTTFLDDATIANPISSPLVDILYIVNGTDTNNCVNTDTVNIKININDEYYVPIAFSPNNDGDNDVFLVRGLQGEKDFLLKIYDRWGNKVFESQDKNNAWDGAYNGKNLKSGVFVYVIDITLLNEQVLPRKTGNLTLIR